MNKLNKLDMADIPNIMNFMQKMNGTVTGIMNEIISDGSAERSFIQELKKHVEELELLLMQEKPYIEGEYNPDYEDTRICECGHTYAHHFDSYENMKPVGCKYCPCFKFVELKKSNTNWAELSDDAKSVLEWCENVVTDNHDIMEIQIGKYFDRKSVRFGTIHIPITKELYHEIRMWCVSHNDIEILTDSSDYCKFKLK